MPEHTTPAGETLEKRSETTMESAGIDEQDDSPTSITAAERARGERQAAD